MAKAIGSGERARRKGLVAEWRRSGLSAAGFGERHGLSQWALYAWAKEPGSGSKRPRRKRRPSRSSKTGDIPAFIPVRLVGDGDAEARAGAEGAVEIQLRGGDVVRVFGEVSTERLRAVVMAIRQAC